MLGKLPASYRQVKGATRAKMTREEAIRHLGTYSSTMGSGLTTQEQHEEAKKMAIKALEQEPRKGHWKYDRAIVRCSNCGRGYKDAFGRTSVITYNFCPNCGADMRAESEK